MDVTTNWIVNQLKRVSRPVLQSFRDSKRLTVLAIVSPVLILYALVTIIPISFSVFASFFDVSTAQGGWTFVGFQNYAEIFQLPRFWGTMERSVVFMVGSTVLQTIVGVGMALALNRLDIFKRGIRTLVFAAYLIPTVIATIVFLFLFDVFVGPLHFIGSDVLGLWAANTPILNDGAMTMVILLSAWKFSVFITILTLAQLQAIPSRFYEAARVCGANRWQAFRDVTFPRIKNIVIVAILLRGVWMFNKFDFIYLLTSGGPGYDTTTLPILAYRETFQGGAYGRGSALAVIMALTLIIGAIAYFKVFNPSEEVET